MRLPAYLEYSLRASHLQAAVYKTVLVQVTDSNSSSKLHSGSGSEAIIGASSMGVIACKKSLSVERLEPGSGRLHHALKMGTVARIGAQMVYTILPQWHIS
jgi:hypothetical protein